MILEDDLLHKVIRTKRSTQKRRTLLVKPLFDHLCLDLILLKAMAEKRSVKANIITGFR